MDQYWTEIVTNFNIHLFFPFYLWIQGAPDISAVVLIFVFLFSFSLFLSSVFNSQNAAHKSHTNEISLFFCISVLRGCHNFTRIKITALFSSENPHSNTLIHSLETFYLKQFYLFVFFFPRWANSFLLFCCYVFCLVRFKIKLQSQQSDDLLIRICNVGYVFFFLDIFPTLKLIVSSLGLRFSTVGRSLCYCCLLSSFISHFEAKL